ncbi:MAG: IclR family transcriptional regulator [Actinomycetota bacterium]|nr:IclR family transcriptional regulator [Actinomycetota bacterium]
MAETSIVENDKPIYPIGSVDSAMRLLLMIGERDRVRIAEAANELGVARSTAHRLMQMLLYHGFVRQDLESKAYVAGSKLIGLGLQVMRKLDVRTIARPYMESLCADVGETVHLFALQAERGVLCLDSVEGPRGLRVGSRTGIVLAAHASSSGRALLSTLPIEDVMEMYPSKRLPKHEHSSIKLRSELLERLESARNLGYAVQRDESEDDVSAISAPLRTDDGVASFALTVALPTSRLSDEAVPQIGDAVIGYAREVAASLGL